MPQGCRFKWSGRRLFWIDRLQRPDGADNFTLQDLTSVMAFLHGHGVRGYVTMNTLVFADELAAGQPSPPLPIGRKRPRAASAAPMEANSE